MLAAPSFTDQGVDLAENQQSWRLEVSEQTTTPVIGREIVSVGDSAGPA